MKQLLDIGNNIFDCICLSVLWVIFSLPVVTMGAAASAVYATVYRHLRRKEGYLWQTFWMTFKDNIRHSLGTWLIAIFVLAILTLDALVFRTMEINGSVFGKVYWIVLIMIGIASTWTVYLTAYTALFNGTIKESIRISFILMVYHPIQAIKVFLLLLGGVVVMLIAPGLLIVIPSLVIWMCSYVLEKVFLIHMRPEDIEKLMNET